MRRLVVTLMAGALVALGVTSAALAQENTLRDPFDPVADENQDVTATTEGTTDTTGTTDPTDEVQPAQETTGSERLANTGAETDPWLVGAYGLIAAGAAALILGKLLASPRATVVARAPAVARNGDART